MIHVMNHRNIRALLELMLAVLLCNVQPCRPGGQGTTPASPEPSTRPGALKRAVAPLSPHPPLPVKSPRAMISRDRRAGTVEDFARHAGSPSLRRFCPDQTKSLNAIRSLPLRVRWRGLSTSSIRMECSPLPSRNFRIAKRSFCSVSIRS